MLEAFLGSNDLNDIPPVEPENPSTPHFLQIRRQALQLCSFVMGHLPEHLISMEEVHRVQNTFCLRALLLRSLQEAGEWEDFVEGIEIGINFTLAPPAGSARTTLDDLLCQVHCVGKSVYGISDTGTLSRDGVLNSFDGSFLQRQINKMVSMFPNLLWSCLGGKYSNQ